jgi:hypothetical protein
MATFQSNLSEVLRRLKRLDEAEALARLALDTTIGTREPNLDSASVMVALSRILADRGRIADAEQLLVEALTIRRERLGQGHPDVKRAAADLEQLRSRRPK